MQEPFNLVIACAGFGSRFKSNLPKQFIKVNGKSILSHSLSQFESFNVGQCILAVSEDYLEHVSSYISDINYPIAIIKGGKTRTESIKNALVHCKDFKTTLIHDAVRPCVSSALIKRVLVKLEKSQAVIPVIPVVDTIKEVKEGVISKTIDRSNLVCVQTPQGFQTSKLKKVYSKDNLNSFTDDAALMEANSYSVSTVVGDQTNIKITVSSDQDYFQYYLDCVQKNN